MSDVQDAVQDILADVKPSPTQPMPPSTVPPHVAANILEFLKRVQVQGMEAFALVEAMGCLRQFAAPPPTGPGVPFSGV